MYSLSQDNWPFRKKMLNEPEALKILARVVTNEAGSKVAPKGKNKADVETKEDVKDLSNLLMLLVCGRFCFRPRILEPCEPRLSGLTMSGVLRNVVDSDSEADQYVHIDRLTNEFALGLINELVSLDTSGTVARVFELVNEAVSADTCDPVDI